jgi:rhamnogalacturonan endolyase
MLVLQDHTKQFFCFVLLFCALFFLPMAAHADFGLTTTDSFYTVDTGAGLVFSVRRIDLGVSTQSPGDISSLQINGVEYQDQSRGSQINSGFDWLYTNVSAVTVNAEIIDTDYIKITVQAGSLTHYYMAHRGEPRIYMATYFTAEPQVQALVRYILRLKKSLLPNGPTPSDISQTVSTVESSDIFALANGQTRSKHYSNHRVVDWNSIGATGDNVGVWVIRDNYEGASGGPFYRCLLNQGTATDQEITYIVNYGEIQTESMRTGVLNHYTLDVTDGSEPDPDALDTSFFSKMGMTGYVSTKERGKIRGSVLSGQDNNYEYWAGFSNAQAQYWRRINHSGDFVMGDMLPGDYTVKIYKNELAVYTYPSTVTVTAHTTNHLDSIYITADPAKDAAIWRVGLWDGSPQEFLNGDKVTTMHPSDVRMSNWVVSPYSITGTTDTDKIASAAAKNFPAYLWKSVNSGSQINFKLTADQLQTAHTLRIGLTVSYSNARPQITVNSWTSAIPTSSTQPATRSLTVGSYRGNNVTYTYAIPASAWKTNAAEWNTLTINAVSGKTGTTYLSPGFSIDAIDLLQ